MDTRYFIPDVWASPLLLEHMLQRRWFITLSYVEAIELSRANTAQRGVNRLNVDLEDVYCNRVMFRLLPSSSSASPPFNLNINMSLPDRDTLLVQQWANS
jgi:hypothetical protein